MCAPAGPVEPERLQNALESLRSDGFDVVTSPSVFERSGLFSAPDAVRRRELEDMFLRDDVDAVFCARGGVGSSRLLAGLNAETIIRSRKPFLGFSDITALQWMLWKRHEFLSFSGPLAIEWKDRLSAVTKRHALDLLSGRSGVDLLAGFSHHSIRVIRGKGTVRGRLLPGNLTMMTTLLGTPFCPDLTGTILLIEDVNEPPHRIDRMLFHLRNAGILHGLAGLLVGELEYGNEGELKNSVVQSLVESTDGTAYPITMGLPYGHGRERMTLPVGALVEWDCEQLTLKVHEPVTDAR